MPRTTVDIDGPILHQLKTLSARHRRPLGKLITELVAEALANRRASPPPDTPRLEWISKPMHATVDWADQDALDALVARDDQERLARVAQAGTSRPEEATGGS